MNTSNNLPQLPPPRKSPGRWLYAAWLGVSILPLLIQPASATTIWEKATEIMKDVYQQILLISTIAAAQRHLNGHLRRDKGARQEGEEK